MFCKWIHEFNWFNSRVSMCEFTGFCEQIWCINMCLPWNRVFHVMIYTRETVPVLTQYDSCQTRSKLVTTGRTWIHMKTYTGGAVPIMNQYVTCQMVQKWFLVCWVTSCVHTNTSRTVVSHIFLFCYLVDNWTWK